MPTTNDSNNRNPQEEDLFATMLAQPAPEQASSAPASSPAQDGTPSSSEGEGSTQAESFVGGAYDAVTFGFGDEIEALLSTAIGNATLSGEGVGTRAYWNRENANTTFYGQYRENLGVLRGRAEQQAEDNPWTYFGGQVGGSLLIPYGAGAKGTVQVAKVGAVQGGVYGVGSGEGLEGRATEGVQGALAGGTLGAFLGRFLPGLKSNRADDAVSITPEQEAEAVAYWNKQSGNSALDADSALDWYKANNIPPPTRADVEGAVDAAKRGSTFRGLTGGQAETSPGARIVGETNTGQLLVRETIEEGAEEAASEKNVRGALEALQERVQAGATRQAREGNRAADVTWETSPDVAARAGEWRIGSLGSGNNAQSLLREMVEGVTSKTTRSDEELAQAAVDAASDIGEDSPEAVLELARTLAGKLGDADTTMMALRTLWGKASQDVTQYHLLNVNWASASDELVEEAAGHIYNLSQLSHLVQEAKTGLGRGLRANQLPTADVYLQSLRSGGKAGPRAADEAPLPTTREEIDDWFELWGATGGDRKRQSDFLRGMLTIPPAGKYLRQSFANFFTASILSAPRTLALNILGPGTISVIRNVERFTGAGMQALSPLATPAQRSAARTTARMTGKAYVQTFTEIGDAFRMALVSAKRNHTVIGGGSQTWDALSSYGPLTENLMRAAGQAPNLAQRTAYSMGNLINVWPRAFARLNNGLDEFSKRMAYQGEVRINALVDGYEKGLRDADLADYVHKAMTEAYDDVGMASNRELLRSAERTTLTARVGEEGSQLRTFGNYMQRLRGDIPELRFIIPIFNVPVNALGETLRRLPIARIPGLNNLMFSQTAKELAGELGPVARAEAHGRFMLGAAFLTAGYMMNQQGMLTGAGPQNPTDRKVWLLTNQPYSIRLGDQWVRYDKFDVFGSLMSIPATVADATTYNPSDQEQEEYIFAGVGALAQWFKDRAALRNAASLLALGDDPTKDTGRTFESLAGAISSGFYPAAARTLLTDAGTNPYVPMRRSWTDYIEAALPGNTVEPLRNILGEPIRKSIDTVPEALVPVSLVKAVGYEDDPVLDELERVYSITGYGAGADSSSVSYGFFPEKDLKLEDGMSLYGRFMQMRQTVEIDGMTLREALLDLFDSPEYAEAVDGSSTRKETSLGQLNRPRMISRIFTQYNAEIKAQLADESQIAADYMAAANAKRIDSAYLRDVSVEELVRNPDLYRANGLDREVYSVGGGRTSALLEAIEGGTR